MKKQAEYCSSFFLIFLIILYFTLQVNSPHNFSFFPIFLFPLVIFLFLSRIDSGLNDITGKHLHLCHSGSHIATSHKLGSAQHIFNHKNKAKTLTASQSVIIREKMWMSQHQHVLYFIVEMMLRHSG